MRVQDIMTENPRCCSIDSTLQEVARLMCQANVGEIPVEENGKKLAGVVTDRDIVCRGAAKGRDLAGLSARDCMSAPAVTVTPETSVEECLRTLEEHRIRRVPVVDRDNRCVGIVAQADIALKLDSDRAGELVREVSHA